MPMQTREKPLWFWERVVPGSALTSTTTSPSSRQRSFHDLVRRTANRLKTTCVRSRGVVRGRAASSLRTSSCDPLRYPCG